MPPAADHGASGARLAAVLALRERLYDAGFRPVAIYNHDAPHPSPGKAPKGDAWRERALRDPPEAAIRSPDPDALNTGILCDGLRAIDLDVDNLTLAKNIQTVALQRFGEAPLRYRGNSARTLLLYRATSGTPGKVAISSGLGKVEILGAGQQFVAFGTHTSGSELRWMPEAPGDIAADALPAVTEEGIQAFLEEAAHILGAKPPGPAPAGAAASPKGLGADALQVVAALVSIPNSGPPDWEYWNRVGMAAWAATSGSAAGLAAFHAWSGQNPAYDPAETEARWAHYATSPPNRIGAGTLFHLAKQARPVVEEDEPPPADTDDPGYWASFEEVPPDRDEEAASYTQSEHQSEQQAEEPPRGRRFGKLCVLSVDDLETASHRGYLLKGLLSPAEMSLWVGPPKCGKSFLLLHIAYLLSLGRMVFGRRVKATRVVYVAAEGEGGIANRIRALRDRYGSSQDFHFIAQPADLLHHDGQLHDLERAVRDFEAGLVVIDTLSRVLAGGDENSPQDMGAFVKNVSDLRHNTGAHVAVVHHGTKASGGINPRGHSSLTGADDALIEVAKLDDGSRCATVIHAKDDPDGIRWGFKLKSVDLGVDPDGDEITTLIVDELVDAPSRPEKVATLSPIQQIALTCLDEAIREGGVRAVVGDDLMERPVARELDWRRLFYRQSKPGESQDTKKKAFARAVEALIAKRRVAVADNYAWRPEQWGA